MRPRGINHIEFRVNALKKVSSETITFINLDGFWQSVAPCWIGNGLIFLALSFAPSAASLSAAVASHEPIRTLSALPSCAFCEFNDKCFCRSFLVFSPFEFCSAL
jgi:hypothetical protein